MSLFFLSFKIQKIDSSIKGNNMVFNMREGLNNKKEYLQKAVIELAIFILCILSTISIKMQLYVIYEETDGFLGNVQRTLYSFQGWGIENFLITIGLLSV